MYYRDSMWPTKLKKILLCDSAVLILTLIVQHSCNINIIKRQREYFLYSQGFQVSFGRRLHGNRNNQFALLLTIHLDFA